MRGTDRDYMRRGPLDWRQRRRVPSGSTAGLAALVMGITAASCVVEPKPLPPDPQAERDRQCAEQFIAPRIPTPQDVAYLFPNMLNPRDAQGRPIYTAMRQPNAGPPGGYCYVESAFGPPGLQVAPPNLGPAGMLQPPAPPTPPGLPVRRDEVPCPPVMQDPRWWSCPEGRILTNAAVCPCVCFISRPMAPPHLAPISCPPPG